MRSRMKSSRAANTEYFEVTCRPSEKVRLKYLAINRNMTMQEYVRYKVFGDWTNSFTEAERLKMATRDLKDAIKQQKQLARNVLARKFS